MAVDPRRREVMGGENSEPERPSALWSESEAPVPLLGAGTAAGVSEAVGRNGDETRTGSATLSSPVDLVAASAADFSPERMLRAADEQPASGWRRAVFSLTGGLVRIGPSAAELRYRELVGRVKTPVRGCRKVAFISRKGGVGKTTTCLLAGHTFATYRGDRVIALDGNPDAGTLGHRLRRETTATVTNLLADAGEIERYADIRGYTSQAGTRLEVVAADDDPHITQAIGEAEFARAIELLERHYNLVCLDTGTGVLDSATRGILDASDQIVVVIAPSLDSARAASSTLDWLEENGYRRLVDGAVGVVNAVRPAATALDIDRIEEHFAARCRATVRIPWDRHLEAGAETVVEELASETRQAYLELAAAIAAGFAQPLERR
jgi:putative peptide zinc metalloprotease protein